MGEVAEVLGELLGVADGGYEYAVCDAFVLGDGCGACHGDSCGECFHDDEGLDFAARRENEGIALVEEVAHLMTVEVAVQYDAFVYGLAVVVLEVSGELGAVSAASRYVELEGGVGMALAVYGPCLGEGVVTFAVELVMSKLSLVIS